MTKSITNPREFFELIVTPDFNDYYDNNQGDIRLAFHVCMSLDHLADWIAGSKGQKRKDFLRKKYKQCSYVEDIRDLSSNVKHFIVTHAPDIDMMPTNKSLNISDWGMIDDVQSWDKHGAGPQIKALYANGREYWLVNVVSGAFRFWKDEYDKKLW